MILAQTLVGLFIWQKSDFRCGKNHSRARFKNCGIQINFNSAVVLLLQQNRRIKILRSFYHEKRIMGRIHL